MDGPQHYLRAEQLLDDSRAAHQVSTTAARADAEIYAMRALAHAQLADTAARVEASQIDCDHNGDPNRWGHAVHGD